MKKLTGTYIDVTPTWAQIMPAILMALEEGTPKGKAIARDELMDLAKKVDNVNGRSTAHEKLIKASKDQYACLKTIIREGLLEGLPGYIQDAVNAALEAHEKAIIECAI